MRARLVKRHAAPASPGLSAIRYIAEKVTQNWEKAKCGVTSLFGAAGENSMVDSFSGSYVEARGKMI
jgi:hypothetical protein